MPHTSLANIASPVVWKVANMSIHMSQADKDLTNTVGYFAISIDKMRWILVNMTSAKPVKGCESVKQTSRGIEPQSIKTLPTTVLVEPAKHISIQT